MNRPAARHDGMRRAVVGSVARAVVGVVIVIVAFYLLPVAPHSHVGAVVRIVAVASIVIVVIAVEVRAVARSPHPAVRAIDALALTVAVLIGSFAVVYLNISARDAAAFNEPLGRTSALYFTMVTLATIGFGDIAPRSDGARVAVMVQIVFNVVVIGVTVRVIVGMVKRRVAGRATEDPP